MCYCSCVGGGGRNGRELLYNSVACLVSHLSKIYVTFILCHIHKLSARCKFNLNLWRGLHFKFCFTSVFLQDDVSSPGDLVIADGGKYIKSEPVQSLLNCLILPNSWMKCM